MEWRVLCSIVFLVVLVAGYFLMRYNRQHDGKVRAMQDKRIREAPGRDAIANSVTQPSTEVQQHDVADSVASAASTTSATPQGSSPASSQSEPDGQNAGDEHTAMDMWLSFLHGHNCDVMFDQSNDNVFWFRYQGGSFRVMIRNEYIYDILFPQIYDVPMDDYDAISRVRKAINEVNMYSLTTLFYIFDEQAARMIVHVRRVGLIVPETRNADGVLSCMLSECFKAQRCFDAELQTLADAGSRDNKPKCSK